MKANFNLETSKYILANRIFSERAVRKVHSSDIMYALPEASMTKYVTDLYSYTHVQEGPYSYIGMSVFSIYSFSFKH